MEVITQTNRTLLLEEINPEKLDLLTLVGDIKGKDSLSDEKIKEISHELLVHNFDEFMEKFDPVIYYLFNANDQKIVYTLKKPENFPPDLVNEIHLNQNNDFLKMLMTLVEAKRAQGVLNVDFKFEKLTDMISPKRVMDDIRQLRKEMRYVYSEYVKLDEGDPVKLDVADKLNMLFEEASMSYNNVLAMLPLAIEDIKTRLLLNDPSMSKSETTPLLLGVLSMDDDGELKVLEAPKTESTALVQVDDHVNGGLIEALEEDYVAVNDQPNDYVKALVTRTFCPLASTMVTEVDAPREITRYNSYLDFYKMAKNDFIKTVKPLIEKILGVWAFFEQHPKNVKDMVPSLLISNVSNEMLAQSTSIQSLKTYLNSVNEKNDFTNTVWYAIIPSISLNPASKIRVTRERFRGNQDKENPNVNSMESLVRILDLLKDFEIQCFYSYESGERTTFNSMAVEGIDKYVERCVSLRNKPFSEFTIPCIPNFTIIPKEKSGVILDKRIEMNENHIVGFSDAKEDIMKLWIEGVYVGAAYVAAGLVSAYQRPGYLKQKFKRKVDKDLPGVRFDVEAGNHPLHVYTTMAKEITGFTNNIKNDINHRNFGFVFSSENAISDDGENITNIMVYKARNMKEVAGNYEPIYKTQVTTYVERILRHATGDFKQDSIVSFFSSNPSSQKSQWKEKRECVNAIIGVGDDIDCHIDEENDLCILDITFNGDVKNLTVEINRMTAKERSL